MDPRVERKIKARLRWKTLWRDRQSRVWSFYCPNCRSSRRLPNRTSPSLRHYIQIGLTSAFFTLLTWPWFNWKGFVSFIPMWMIFETLHRARVRVALYCSNCGFDPYLYLQDVTAARKEVETYWRKKFADKGIPYPEKEDPAEQAQAMSDAKEQVRAADEKAAAEAPAALPPA